MQTATSWLILIGPVASIAAAIISGITAVLVISFSRRALTRREEFTRKREKLERLFMILRDHYDIWMDIKWMALHYKEDDLFDKLLNKIEELYQRTRESNNEGEMIIAIYAPQLHRIYGDYSMSTRNSIKSVLENRDKEASFSLDEHIQRSRTSIASAMEVAAQSIIRVENELIDLIRKTTS